jgi:hypothetical protein
MASVRKIVVRNIARMLILHIQTGNICVSTGKYIVLYPFSDRKIIVILNNTVTYE